VTGGEIGVVAGVVMIYGFAIVADQLGWLE
jgi:hypothetical protein